MSEFNNSVESMIDNIVTVVFRIHFYYVNSYDLEMDLKQEGYLKAYSLLKEGNYDPTKNLRTFIYTGVRNAMTNYMYHTNKENHLDLEDITSQSWQSNKDVTLDGYWEGRVYTNDLYSNKSDINLDIDLLFEICDKYKMFGDYFEYSLYKLKQLGLYNNKVTLNNKTKFNDFITNSILGEFFYKALKNY